MSKITPPRFAVTRAVLAYAGLPLLLFAAGAGLLVLLGLMQRAGWLKVDAAGHGTSAVAADVDYICPMMCVPPVKEPGRCPVCAMELVPAAGGNSGDERSVVVDPATRRVANIQTVAASARAVSRTIRSVGELQYDEGSLRTITAYSAGRLEDLFVDYTGAVVSRGDRLATLYSPQLHAAAVGYLQTLQTEATASRLAAVAQANQRLRDNARLRLVELGLTETQIAALQSRGEPETRVVISAPLAGTVIERMAVEGQSVQEGQPLFRLADLSSVWLMLELFPEDAHLVRYGQKVQATMKSIPGETFSGRIAFIDPEVDAATRTVQVRVVMDNSDGRLRIGDYATAAIVVPIGQSPDDPLYDPELADKWISPRHPHIVADQPGACPQCGEPLVAAADLGFTAIATEDRTSVTVPRHALLQAAGHSVLYVEESPGRFAIRRVVAGASVGEDVVISRGLAEGETVATGGSFLLDSQMQLAGNPSLIDPLRAEEPVEMIPGFDRTMLAAIQQLPADEQYEAIAQKICPVTRFPLGAMGVPPKASVDGRSVYLCCEGCRTSLMKDPQSYLKQLPAENAHAADPGRVPLPRESAADSPDTPTGSGASEAADESAAESADESANKSAAEASP